MLLEEKLKDRELIPGSRSPRRRDLLAACGFDFSVEDYHVEDRYVTCRGSQLGSLSVI